MKHRRLVPLGVLAIPIAFVWLAAVPVAGQGPSTAAKTKGTPTKAATAKPAATKAYTPPRTPDGQPDLQGFWTNSTYTPLERPANVTKDFYTPAELEVAIKRAIELYEPRWKFPKVHFVPDDDMSLLPFLISGSMGESGHPVRCEGTISAAGRVRLRV